jgi:hypothetical protein
MKYKIFRAAGNSPALQKTFDSIFGCTHIRVTSAEEVFYLIDSHITHKICMTPLVKLTFIS